MHPRISTNSSTTTTTSVTSTSSGLIRGVQQSGATPATVSAAVASTSTATTSAVRAVMAAPIPQMRIDQAPRVLAANQSRFSPNPFSPEIIRRIVYREAFVPEPQAAANQARSSTQLTLDHPLFQEVRHMYEIQLIPYPQIYEKLGVSRNSIIPCLRQAGVYIRTTSESRWLSYAKEARSRVVAEGFSQLSLDYLAAQAATRGWGADMVDILTNPVLQPAELATEAGQRIEAASILCGLQDLPDIDDTSDEEMEEDEYTRDLQELAQGKRAHTDYYSSSEDEASAAGATKKAKK